MESKNVESKIIESVDESKNKLRRLQAIARFVALLELRGGQDFQDLDHINKLERIAEENCSLPKKGSRFLNNLSFRELIFYRFSESKKAKNSVILITRSTVCYLAKIYFLENRSKCLNSLKE